MGFGRGRGSRCSFTRYLPQQEEEKKEERKQVERKERNGGRKEERKKKKNERRMNQSNVIFLHKTQEQTCTYWGEIKEEENSR